MILDYYTVATDGDVESDKILFGTGPLNVCGNPVRLNSLNAAVVIISTDLSLSYSAETRKTGRLNPSLYPL